MVLRGKPVGEQGAADRWTALALLKQARWGGGASAPPPFSHIARRAARRRARAPAARVEGRGARARLPRLRVQWVRCVPCIACDRAAALF